MEKPTIILVHGFWGGAAHWSKVIPHLLDAGYPVRAVENPLTSLADDVERTRKMIRQAPGAVILVGHSYGGAVITEVGNEAQVQALVYIAGFAPDSGESAGQISAQNPAAAIGNVTEDSDGYLWVAADKFRESFCQDIDADTAAVLAVTQRAPRAATFSDTITNPAWKTKPAYYQISTEDRMINPQNQIKMAQRMEAVRTLQLQASHSSLISNAPAISQLICEAAQTSQS